MTLSCRVWGCSSIARSPAQHIYVQSPKTYPDKWWVFLGKWKADSGIDKVPCLRAKNLLAAMQPNLISALGQRISKGVMSVRRNECFLCITGQRGAFRPGREKGNEPLIKNPCFSSPSYCVFVHTLFHHILCSDTSNTNKGCNHGKYSSLLLPTMSPSSPYTQLSFLPDSPHSALLASCNRDH